MNGKEHPAAANRDRGHPAVNVLVTSAGRRTSLVRAFTEEAHKRGGRVHAGDVDALAPALYLADEALQTRRTDDPAYVADLLGAVALHAIGLVVPTIDTDLLVLAASKASFGTLGCRIAVSTESFVEVTLDKHQTGITFGAAGIRVPLSWLPPIASTADLPQRVFVKPRRGSASQGAYEIARDELESVLRLVPEAVVQEVLTGPEITVDALFDFEGRPIHFVPRRRIRTLGGESVQGVTLDHDPTIEAWIERVLNLCSELGALGPMTIQAFLTKDGPVLSEINPRFGGGFPLALAAGGNYPLWLLDMVEGRHVEPRLREFESGLFMTRYNVEHFMRQPKW
jgi:carbamoyl-phosphate synthase large subunit